MEGGCGTQARDWEPAYWSVGSPRLAGKGGGSVGAWRGPESAYMSA